MKGDMAFLPEGLMDSGFLKTLPVSMVPAEFTRNAGACGIGSA
jgi:hypothetical protein